MPPIFNSIFISTPRNRSSWCRRLLMVWMRMRNSGIDCSCRWWVGWIAEGLNSCWWWLLIYILRSGSWCCQYIQGKIVVAPVMLFNEISDVSDCKNNWFMGSHWVEWAWDEILVAGGAGDCHGEVLLLLFEFDMLWLRWVTRKWSCSWKFGCKRWALDWLWYVIFEFEKLGKIIWAASVAVLSWNCSCIGL